MGSKKREDTTKLAFSLENNMLLSSMGDFPVIIRRGAFESQSPQTRMITDFFGCYSVLNKQHFFNEFYARDTSRKIRAVQKAKGVQGVPLTVNVPYGYVKDPENPRHWLIDPEAAQVVRRIFQMCMEGRVRLPTSLKRTRF